MSVPVCACLFVGFYFFHPLCNQPPVVSMVVVCVAPCRFIFAIWIHASGSRAPGHCCWDVIVPWLFACASFLIIIQAESGACFHHSGVEAHVKPRCCYKLSHERISILKWFKLSDCNGRLYTSTIRESRHLQRRRPELSSNDDCCST